ncbi:RNA polymerase sigma factor [Myxococcus sp. CA040A]|uniref:RNA polymerase sigma factor n=1 Tax=Myxococcus sp. CA040A TaxID=2741738 RepID=UPI00157B82F1|nr:sigma-70 family RNA polymerase sigma factor [Myxococcus sp. CA040A]NTX07691.1 sigma-70 family RNA polymerase sigma factor [Myxococcus sp. CA040A]
MEAKTTGFWELWLCHHPKLLAKSLRHLGGHQADAEDALSTAMLRAAEAWPREVQRLRNPEAWLTRILHNACVDLHRRRARRAEEPPEQDDEAPSEAVQPAYAPSPEQLILEQEQSQLLWRHVHRLPEPLRRACLLRFERELDGRSMAVELGITHVNTRRRLLRAYQVLRLALGTSARGTDLEPPVRGGAEQSLPPSRAPRARRGPTTRWRSGRARPPRPAHRRVGG